MNFKDRLCAMNCHYRFYELEDFFQSVHKLGMHYVELWSGPMLIMWMPAVMTRRNS